MACVAFSVNSSLNQAEGTSHFSFYSVQDCSNTGMREACRNASALRESLRGQ